MFKRIIKTIFIALLLVSSLFLFSCKSTDIPIPGQSNIVLKNVHKEYVKLGDSYFSLEKYNDAISCYKIAWEDKELYWPCYYKVAKCYVLLSDWGNALQMYEELLNKDLDNSTLKASIAYIYSMSGDYVNALQYYKEIISQQPKDEKYLENYIALLLSDKKIFDDNRSEFENQFENFKKVFPENKNIDIFQNKYNDFTVEKKEE